jgi:[ribosomal protein S5]-alanine N-acetyltransferase
MRLRRRGRFRPVVVAAPRIRLEAEHTAIRPLERKDADELATLVAANRAHTEPWDPVRGEA